MLDGVTVEFPFEPYACQVEFMRQVTSALQTVGMVTHVGE